jgi:hypothetical protein
MNETPNTTNDEVAPPPLPSEAFFQPRYKGLGGWLLLLCLILAVFNPLWLVLGLFNPKGLRTQFVDVLAAIDAVGFVLLNIGSLYAGLKLWRIRPGAVKTAKRYLLCTIGFVAFHMILTFMFGAQSARYKTEDYTETAKTIGFNAIWYLYLLRSRRVKNTYL